MTYVLFVFTFRTLISFISTRLHKCSRKTSPMDYSFRARCVIFRFSVACLSTRRAPWRTLQGVLPSTLLPCKKIDWFRRPSPLNDALKFIENKFTTGRHKDRYTCSNRMGRFSFELILSFVALYNLNIILLTRLFQTALWFFIVLFFK